MTDQNETQTDQTPATTNTEATPVATESGPHPIVPSERSESRDPELEPRHSHHRSHDDDDVADEPEAPLDPAAAKREALDKHFLDVVEFERVRDVVARHCSTSLGRKVLRRMKPLRSREQATLCLEQTDEMVKLVHERERIPMADLHDAGGLLRRAIETNRPLEPRELRKVVATLDAARSLRDVVNALSDEKYPRLKSLVRHLDPVPPVEEAIRRTIDARGEVRDDASERLTVIR
ncbi:MAG: hypothetical protein ACAI25_05045, partial [Planctomycetota bacterium]